MGNSSPFLSPESKRKMQDKQKRILLSLSYSNKGLPDYNKVVTFAKNKGLTLSQAGKILVNRGLIKPVNKVLNKPVNTVFTKVNKKNKTGGQIALFFLVLICLVGSAIYLVIKIKNEGKDPGEKFNIFEFFGGKPGQK